MWMLDVAHVPCSQYSVSCLNIQIKKGGSSEQGHTNSEASIYTITVFKIKLFNKSIVYLENLTVVPRLLVLQDISDLY